ncbi:MAG: hypothetical protein ACOYYS_07810 [Chloroflexota bacterium]
MTANVIVLRSQDPLIEALPFKPYRSTVERLVKQFTPSPNESQSIAIQTPWGETLNASAGDYIISEVGAPEDMWPVEKEIFHESYQIIAPGRCIKKALTYLVPLAAATKGNEDQQVRVETLEGAVTVRAGDFYLARGVKGEIWPMPVGKVHTTLAPVEA